MARVLVWRPPGAGTVAGSALSPGRGVDNNRVRLSLSRGRGELTAAGLLLLAPGVAAGSDTVPSYCCWEPVGTGVWGVPPAGAGVLGRTIRARPLRRMPGDSSGLAWCRARMKSRQEG